MCQNKEYERISIDKNVGIRLVPISSTLFFEFNCPKGWDVSTEINVQLQFLVKLLWDIRIQFSYSYDILKVSKIYSLLHVVYTYDL